MPFCEGGYGVSKVEVAEFVEANPCVSNWLKKYASGVDGGLSGSKLNKARILCRFFKWLRVVKNVDLSPSGILNRQLKLRQSAIVQDRQWLLHLVLEHSRDNPHFKEYADNRKYDIFNAVKNFCDYHEVSLTTAKGVYGKKRKKKNHRKQFGLTKAKQLLGEMNQRDRAICLIILQSGMGIGEVLNKFSYMQRTVKSQLQLQRMKVEFDERKGNGTWYFTFISRDAIHELRKWLQQRHGIVEKLVADGKLDGDVEPIFITNRGTQLSVIEIAKQFNKKYRGKVTTHMFRKLFESEAKVPERGIGLEYIKFFMGHAPIDLDQAGGTYDRNVEIREEIFEREYAKLEPYINIYSSSVATRETDSVLAGVEAWMNVPGGRDFFQGVLDDLERRKQQWMK